MEGVYRSALLVEPKIQCRQGILCKTMQKPFWLVLLFVVIFAAGIRLDGAFSDLPYIFHPDEPRHIVIIQHIFKTGDLNPHFFNYPSMFLYVNSLAYIPYYFIEKLLGRFTTVDDIAEPVILVMGTAFTPVPGTVILSRLVTLLFSLGSIILLFIAGKELTKIPLVGLLAALMLALADSHIASSSSITPDIFVLFWCLAAFLASILIMQQGKTWHYVLAGIAVGFAASSKYNGGLIMLTAVAAHFLRAGRSGITDKRLYLMFFLSGFGFILITPYSVLDFLNFGRALKSETMHYSTGHAGMEGHALTWYIKYLWQTEGVIAALAIVQIVRGVYLRQKETLLTSTFAIVYIAFISHFVVRNDRTLLPAIPFVVLLCSMLLVDLLRAGKAMMLLKWTSVILIIITFALQLRYESLILQEKKVVDSRITVPLWIKANLPKGAKIAVESYSPFVDPETFAVQGIMKMIDNPPQWYMDNNFNYLIFSRKMYHRFYENPTNYAAEVAEYEQFFSNFSLVKIFNDGNFEVKIYEVASSAQT
ncbi:MAG TPA: phospholipid carrier-dependent glycosyltransferase [Thermodesulfovibrionia bacterium]|nr:phospholipid carrier-dependent glycosyltransferase [Thermodesulfovibrionia bacterium]